ncbi:AraC family transcriptional regulator [Paenibacillus sp. N1-5-1-14]|uniref:AraC family transcriptional regulator n=1 Tax=Paenibacillus radicibacter TaxID=2972488 RepID=UPI002158B089|nr:AraC family transcriptional regulator [Paenibacillus radicibacter]MCR8641650.1 AraC family transcriptional regulator [Paenibacillus radicibacter]
MFNPIIQVHELYKKLDKLWCKLQGVEVLHITEVEPQLLDSHVLYVLKSGEGHLILDYENYRLRQDAVHFAAPGQTAGLKSQSGRDMEIYRITFDVSWDNDGSVPPNFLHLQGELPIHRDTQSIVLCENMNSSYSSELPLERYRGQSIFQELLYSLLKNVRLQPESDSHTALDRAKNYIDVHYGEALTVDELAGVAELSAKYFVDLFKKTYGRSIGDYITDVRLGHAKLLMTQTDARLRDIAHQVGYQDEFYFSRKFKKNIGISPSAYVKKRRQRIAAYSPSILGHLLAMQVYPYAAPLHPKWTSYYYDTYRTDIPLHLSAYRYNQDWEANMELLRSAQIDLLICDRDKLMAHEQEQLESLTNVFYISAASSWRAQMLQIAEQLGTVKEANDWLHRYDSRVVEVRESVQHLLAGETTLMLSIHKHDYYVSPTRGAHDVLYHDIQLVDGNDLHVKQSKQPITLQQIARINPDHLFINVCQEQDSINEWQALQATRMWRDLTAVRKNHVYLVSSDPWREYSAYACARMVGDVVGHLVGG